MKKVFAFAFVLALLLALAAPALARSEDFVIENGVLVKYVGSDADVVVPSGVTRIGDNAFDYGSGSYSFILSITIPEGVTSIGDFAFCGCTNLSRLKLPDSLTSIGLCAFDFTALKTIEIPRNMTGAIPFSDWWFVQEINVAADNPAYRSIGGVLYDKSGTTVLKCPYAQAGSYTFPSGVTRIGSGAFSGCSKLTAVTIPAGVTSIGDGAFQDCDYVTSLTIPTSVTYIGSSQFLDSHTSYTGLTDVWYAGSREQWNAIELSPYNDAIANANLHFAVDAPAAPAVHVSVDGREVQWADAVPFIDGNSRTMVPLRAVAEALGLKVDWYAQTREAEFTDGVKTLIFPIGSSTARTGSGRPVQMDTEAVIVNDRTYAPVRYLAEFFGYSVGWDGATKTVLIQTPAAPDVAGMAAPYAALMKELREAIDYYSAYGKNDPASWIAYRRELSAAARNYFDCYDYEAGAAGSDFYKAYALVDLNHDGVDELLFSASLLNGHDLDLVYTIRDGKAMCVDSFQYRRYGAIYGDWIVSSGVAMAGAIRGSDFLKFDGSELVTVESLTAEDVIDWDSGKVLSTTYSSSVRGQLTEAEYLAILGSYCEGAAPRWNDLDDLTF